MSITHPRRIFVRRRRRSAPLVWGASLLIAALVALGWLVGPAPRAQGVVGAPTEVAAR